MLEEQQQERTQPQSIDDIRRHYADEWLLIQILDPTKTFGQAPGTMLAHGPGRAGMFKAARKALNAIPTAALAVVYGGKDLHDGDAFRRELARVAAKEEWDSVNPW
jgi:hypothetical protein